MTQLLPQYNFPVKDNGSVSKEFLQRGINDFQAAVTFITEMPYGRNTDKENLPTVFTDGCGTCSTKHALLKRLADENDANGIQLILCIFKMNAENTPIVKDILDYYGLAYMPEAHNYLRIGREIVDCTKANWSIGQFPGDVLAEREIETSAITGFKVKYHKEFLRNWLEERAELSYSLDELYEIREECIRALGAKS